MDLFRLGQQEASEGREIDGLRVAPPEPVKLQLVFAGIVLTGVFAILGYRLYEVQVARHVELSNSMESMLRARDPKPGRRGDILLRDGTIVATEVVRYSIGIDPTMFDETTVRGVVDRVCALLQVPDAVRRKKHLRLDQNRRAVARTDVAKPLRYLPLAKRLRRETVVEIEAALRDAYGAPAMRGFVVAPTHFRHYPKGAFLGQLLGWAGTGETVVDIRGSAGVEMKLDPYLVSFDGHRIVLKDGLQKTHFVWSEDIDIKPIDGHDIVLTIDGRIQGIVEDELERGARNQRAEGATAIVLDCRNGDVLAMASYPSLDPNRVYLYPQEELKKRRANRAIERQFEPGSTIKPFWAAGALDARLFTPDSFVWGGGRTTRILGRRVSDVSDHGAMTFRDAVVHSSNIGMTIVGLKLGKERLYGLSNRFHFQEPTGLPVPGEAVGKRTALDRWTEKYTTISVSFGFELSVTPIQLAAAYACVVNGGRYFAPRLVDRIENGTDVHEFPPRELDRAVTESTSRVMREILHQVVEEGTGRRWKLNGFPFGGKTGTAPISKGRAGYASGGKDYLSSFAAFAPYPDPEVVILVMIEKPKKHYYGSTVCGPVVREIIRRVYRVVEREVP